MGDVGREVARRLMKASAGHAGRRLKSGGGRPPRPRFQSAARASTTHTRSISGTPMPRLAVFTPLPPSRSGIAQYSAELLPLLACHAELDVYIADDAPTPDPPPTWATVRRAGQFTELQAAYDAILYQLGNNPAHAYI